MCRSEENGDSVGSRLQNIMHAAAETASDVRHSRVAIEGHENADDIDQYELFVAVLGEIRKPDRGNLAVQLILYALKSLKRRFVRHQNHQKFRMIPEQLQARRQQHVFVSFPAASDHEHIFPLENFRLE